jgi:hypothetical protein
MIHVFKAREMIHVFKVRVMISRVKGSGGDLRV